MLGHLSSRTYGGATLSYQPNALGQPTQVKEASTLYASNVQYHPNNQLSSFTYGNGLRFSQTTQNVDTISDLVNATHSLSLGYDGLDRLVRANGSWGNGWLSYDTLGNIKTKHFGAQTLNYQYNSNNLLLSIPGHYQFIYDDRGNVIHNGQRSFNFNRANQLTSSGTASYRYDGHNRRVHKSGNTQGYSVYNVAGQLLLTENEQGQVRYIHLGNTLLAKAGMVHTPQDTPGYTGHLTDQDLSLTYMQARYYDPVIGRFYSNDPVGVSSAISFNRYAYANNNPYKYIDPNGEFAVPWHGGITFFASWSSGHSFRESLSIAYRAMQADWEKGSQGSSTNACARHAMECPKSSPGEARLLHAQLISGALAGGDLGLAAHAIQDQFAGGHSDFAFWPGGFKELGVWGTVKHLFSDIFPSFSAVSNSYSATKQALTGKQNNSGSQSGTSSGLTVFTEDPDDRCGIACPRGTIQDELRRRDNVNNN